jgi:hypothetical protein
MTFQSWKTVCPRCSEQNGSALNPCSNCGKGPILYELYKYYQTRRQRFKCETCKVVYSNVNCLKCGTDISGTVRGGRSLGNLIKLALAGFVLLMLWAWLSNSDDSNKSQGYKPSSPNSGSPSSNSGSSRWQPGTYQISVNGQEIARGTQVICQIGDNATRLTVGGGGPTSADAHFKNDGKSGQTSITQNDNGSTIHWGTLWLDIGTVSQNGQTYTITGTVQRSNPTTQAPYEFEVTCP